MWVRFDIAAIVLCDHAAHCERNDDAGDEADWSQAFPRMTASRVPVTRVNVVPTAYST